MSWPSYYSSPTGANADGAWSNLTHPVHGNCVVFDSGKVDVAALVGSAGVSGVEIAIDNERAYQDPYEFLPPDVLAEGELDEAAKRSVKARLRCVLSSCIICNF